MGRVSRFACVRIPCFAAAVAERCEPALRGRPVAVVTGAPPVTRVVEANAPARAHGVRPGISDTEAGARCPGLVRRARADAAVAAAQHALLEACLGVSPRVEDGGPGLAHVDLTGLARLFGADAAIAARLARAARAVGLEPRIGVAGTRTAARVATQLGPPVHVLAPAGESRALAATPLAALALEPDLLGILGRWGVVTLGDLAALPREGVASRLGAAGLAAHDLACGRDREPFRPWTPPAFWAEAQGLEWEIESLEALAAALGIVLERLCARLAAAHLLADVLDVRLTLASGAHHVRAVPLAAPMGEVRPILAVLALDLAAHPPAAAVTGVVLGARVVPRRAVRRGLWQPPLPAMRDLAAVLARLATLAGPGNVGAPVLLDSHRPDAVDLAPFAPDAVREPVVPGTPAQEAAGLTLRRLRPSRRIHVQTDDAGRPVVVRGALAPEARVTTCAGPWRTSGEWWDTRAWSHDEWDVALTDGTVCRLAHDHLTTTWLLAAVYD